MAPEGDLFMELVNLWQNDAEGDLSLRHGIIGGL